MLQKPLQVLFIFSLITTSSAWAGNLPEIVAFDAANEAATQIFSSPALPSLDNEGLSISPVYGTVNMEGQTQTVDVIDGENYDVENRGEIQGQVAGLAINHSGKGDLGLFALAAWARVSGNMTSTSPFETEELRDISAETYIGVLGVNYRAVGTAKSFFALGLFGGPAFISSKTSSRIVHGDGPGTTVRLDPESTAAYVGFQMMFRPGQFRINPYLNILANTSLSCYKPKYEGETYPSRQFNRCADGQPGVTALSAMGGVGINVGYGRFQFGLLHSPMGNPAFKTSSLVFSLRVGL